MNPIRIIDEDTPAFIPLPDAWPHRRTEVIVWPLDAEEQIPMPLQVTGKRRRAPPAALAGKVREFGDVMSTLSAVDWGLEP